MIMAAALRMVQIALGEHLPRYSTEELIPVNRRALSMLFADYQRIDHDRRIGPHKDPARWQQAETLIPTLKRLGESMFIFAEPKRRGPGEYNVGVGYMSVSGTLHNEHGQAITPVLWAPFPQLP